jgi:hypothetical protein
VVCFPHVSPCGNVYGDTTRSAHINVTLDAVVNPLLLLGKPLSITYSEFVFVAVGTQRAMLSVICDLSGSEIFFAHLIKGTIFFF